MRILTSALCVLLACATSSLAKDATPIKEMLTANDSKGWEGVGRLDIGRSGFCTGALIEANLVLTAAHCLYNPKTLQRIDASRVEFLAGWRNGRASAYRSVRRAVIHPSYVYTGPSGSDAVAFDLALLELSQPIRNGSITPFETSDRPRAGDEVGVVSYARDRHESPSIQEVCHVLGRPMSSLVLSCDVDFGSSGAPIFVINDGKAQIVSVVSAKAEVRGRKVSLGTSLASSLPELRELLKSDDGVRSVQSDINRKPSAFSTREQGGAKFLRP